MGWRERTARSDGDRSNGESAATEPVTVVVTPPPELRVTSVTITRISPRPVTSAASAAKSGPSRTGAPPPSDVTPRLGYHPALDGLRGIAVVLVVLMHAADEMWPDAVGTISRGGGLGVHLFFVLSGFLITTLLLDEHRRSGHIRLGAFAVRRIRRIAPVAIAFVASLFVVAATGTRLELRDVAATGAQVVTSTTNWFFAGTVLGWFDDRLVVSDALHMWSLAVEVQFYVVLALAVWAVSRRGWSAQRMLAGVGVVVAVVVILRSALAASGTSWLGLYLMTWSRLDAPLAGAAVGVVFAAGWLRRPPGWLGPVATAALAAYVGSGLLLDWKSSTPAARRLHAPRGRRGVDHRRHPRRTRRRARPRARVAAPGLDRHRLLFALRLALPAVRTAGPRRAGGTWSRPLRRRCRPVRADRVAVLHDHRAAPPAPAPPRHAGRRGRSCTLTRPARYDRPRRRRGTSARVLGGRC